MHKSRIMVNSDSLKILKNPIIGYNNKLRVATNDMKFGSNNINYFGVPNQPKKVHQEIQSSHLESLDQKLHIEPHIKPKAMLDSLDEKRHIEHKVNIQTIDKNIKSIGKSNL